MSNEDDLLAFFMVSVHFNDGCEELDESIGSVGFPGSRIEGRKAASGQINGKAGSKVGETGKDGIELGGRAPKPVDEYQERDRRGLLWEFALLWMRSMKGPYGGVCEAGARDRVGPDGRVLLQQPRIGVGSVYTRLASAGGREIATSTMMDGCR